MDNPGKRRRTDPSLPLVTSSEDANHQIGNDGRRKAIIQIHLAQLLRLLNRHLDCGELDKAALVLSALATKRTYVSTQYSWGAKEQGIVCRAGIELLMRSNRESLLDMSKLFNILKLLVPLEERSLVELDHTLSIANLGGLSDAAVRLKTLIANNKTKKFDSILALYRGLLEAALWESYVRTGKHPQAESHLQDAITSLESAFESSSKQIAVLSLARYVQLCEFKGNIVKAINVLKTACAVDSNNPLALRLQYLFAKRNKIYTIAAQIKLLQDIATIDPLSDVLDDIFNLLLEQEEGQPRPRQTRLRGKFKIDDDPNVELESPIEILAFEVAASRIEVKPTPDMKDWQTLLAIFERVSVEFIPNRCEAAANLSCWEKRLSWWHAAYFNHLNVKTSEGDTLAAIMLQCKKFLNPFVRPGTSVNKD